MTTEEIKRIQERFYEIKDLDLVPTNDPEFESLFFKWFKQTDLTDFDFLNENDYTGGAVFSTIFNSWRYVGYEYNKYIKEFEITWNDKYVVVYEKSDGDWKPNLLEYKFGSEKYIEIINHFKKLMYLN